MKGDDFDRLFQDGGDDLDDVVISPSNQPIAFGSYPTLRLSTVVV